MQRDPYILVGNNFGFRHEHAVPIHTLDDAVRFACSKTPGFRKILALDEIGALARARGHMTFPPAAEVVFQQGRKLGLTVYWTTQHWRFTDVYIRRVTERLTHCTGMWDKRISPRGTFPIEHRPRLIRQLRYNFPNPERTEMPEEPSGWRVSWFDKRAANSYDTYALVENFMAVLEEQQAAMQDDPMIAVLYDLMESAERLRNTAA